MPSLASNSNSFIANMGNYTVGLEATGKLLVSPYSALGMQHLIWNVISPESNTKNNNNEIHYS